MCQYLLKLGQIPETAIISLYPNHVSASTAHSSCHRKCAPDSSVLKAQSRSRLLGQVAHPPRSDLCNNRWLEVTGPKAGRKPQHTHITILSPDTTNEVRHTARPPSSFTQFQSRTCAPPLSPKAGDCTCLFGSLIHNILPPCRFGLAAGWSSSLYLSPLKSISLRKHSRLDGVDFSSLAPSTGKGATLLGCLPLLLNGCEMAPAGA